VECFNARVMHGEIGVAYLVQEVLKPLVSYISYNKNMSFIIYRLSVSNNTI